MADRAGEVREEYTGLQEILNMALEKNCPGAENGDSPAGLRGVFLREIAGITGLNESQVKVYIFRARAFESIHPQAGCGCLSGRRYDNERITRFIFMDYMDGNLSARNRQRWRHSCWFTPDLRELLDGMDEVRLDVPAEVFGKKEEIKRTVRERKLNIMPLLPPRVLSRMKNRRGWTGMSIKTCLNRKLKHVPRLK